MRTYTNGWTIAPLWSQRLIGAATILSLVLWTAGPLTARATVVVDHPTPAANPTLGEACGLDIALVLDVSTSISSTELGQMKTAFTSFVTALAPTPSMFSVSKFAGTASVVNAFTANTGDTNAAITAITSGSGGTNFEDGLAKAFSTFDPRADKPDLVVFASDGNPNRKGVAGTSVSESVAMDAAITQANLIKADGIRIITLGIGGDVDADNLKDISSADAYYTAANFSEVGTTLAELAIDLCGGTITVEKLIDSDGNPETAPVAASEGWNFTVGGTPASTDNLGKTAAVEHTQGVYDVTETVNAGYALQSASCTNQNQGAEGTPGANGVTGISLGALDIVSCTFVNVPTTGTLHIVKNVVGGTATPQDFSFTIDAGSPVAFEADGQNDVTVAVGVHNVTESTVAENYTASYVGCSEVNVTPNGEATCTITNTYVPPQCNANAEMTVYSDTSTQEGGNDTVPVDISDADGVQLHEAWTASIPGATWIWGENPPSDTVNDLEETFTKTFTVVGTPIDGTLYVAADNSYTVTLNGIPQCQSAVTNDEYNYSAAGQDTCAIAAGDMVTGVNTLEFKVKNWAQAEGTRESNPAGLMFKLVMHSNQCVEEPACVADVNLISNGSFETPGVAAGGWNIFPSGTLGLEWLVSWFNGASIFGDANRPEVANAELQSNGLNGWLASAGSQWTELDSDWDGPSGSLSGEPASVSLKQTIATIPGETYKVSFDFKPRPDTAGGESKVEALHGAIVGSTVDATAGADWTNHSYTFVASGATTDISFRDAGATANSVGTFLDNVSVMCQPEEEEPTTATVVATKIVCEQEASLPNWGAGAGPDITSSTAADFLEENPTCHLQPDWTFQWAPAGTENPGDNVTVAAGSPWVSFSPTNGSGVASAEVPVDGNYVWMREVLKTGYVPFTYATEGNEDTDNESAEVYCSTDHLHYDNYDRVDSLVAGNTYYCVAFNAPTDEVQPIDVCLNLEGNQSVVPEGYHSVGEGQCVLDSVTDVCPNLEGTQGTVPEGYDLEDGQCVLEGAPQCSDGVDNEDGEDSLVDSQDPGCHTDNDASHPGTYNPNGTTETNGNGGGGGPTTFGGGPIGGGGGGGGGGGIIQQGQVLGVACGLYMDKHLRVGSAKNDKDQTTKLQTFLNKHGFGKFTATGYFGPLTLAAVNQFQQTYIDDVLKPWGINSPTGLVYLSTLRKINLIECPELSLSLPPLVEWSKNPNPQ